MGILGVLGHPRHPLVQLEGYLTAIPISEVAGPTGARLHTPFLERASEPGNRFRAHALGAFLTLRAIDRIAEDPGFLKSDLIVYQLRAAANYLEELEPETNDTNYLREIVRVAQRVSVTSNRRLLWSPLLAFAYWLENELRLDESLDILETTLRLREGSQAREEIAAYLQQGRVLRLSGRFVESRGAYEAGRGLAERHGDLRSAMVSRIGHAGIMQKTGDLPASERELRNVWALAQECGDEYVEARACHDLAVTMHEMGRPKEGVALAFRAFRLYEESVQRVRALLDTGTFLKQLGHYSAAKQAFSLGLDTNPNPEIRVNIVLELLELTFLVQDRVGFERCRRELEGVYDNLPAHESVDFEKKVGAGLAAFGSVREGKAHLRKGIELAEKYGLGQRVFELEALLRELGDGQAPKTHTPEFQHHDLDVDPGVRETIENLYALSS